MDSTDRIIVDVSTAEDESIQTGSYQFRYSR